MKLPETEAENIAEKAIKILYRRFVDADKTLTELQALVLGCELHQNAFHKCATEHSCTVIRLGLD